MTQHPHPLDAVYLWTDGSAAGLSGRRFRDNGELRYSLRSLERFAPWVRTVHVVTDGHLPGWLDRKAPGLSLVSHEEIFPAGGRGRLPCCNSLAIEACLHRVPGLSRRFVYFNDDFFLGAPVSPSDFFTPEGGHRIRFDDWDFPVDTGNGTVTDRAFAGSLRLLDGDSPAPRRRAVAHAPRPYDRERIDELVRAFPEPFARTVGHRFRDPSDAALHVLYYYRLLESPELAPLQRPVTGPPDPDVYRYVPLVPSVVGMARRFHRLARRRPKFFCLNDDLPDAPDLSSRVVQAMTRAFLARYFPGASRFERGRA